MFPSIFSLGEVSQSAISGDTAGSAKLELGLLERRLGDPLATVTVPFDDRVILVSSLYSSAEFSRRLSKVAQPLDPISGSQFLARGNRLATWRSNILSFQKHSLPSREDRTVSLTLPSWR
jgi:hypothetical protein